MNMVFRFVVLVVLLAGTGLFTRFHQNQVIALAKPFAEFPIAHASWRMAGQSNLSDNVIKVLLPTDYLARRYVSSDGIGVDMYLSFFDGGPDSGRIHSPKNCLPGSGWSEMSSEPIVMELGGEKVNLVRAVYAHGETRELIYYWFAMQGKTMTDEFSLKLAEITGSMFHQRRDQSFVRISVQTRSSIEDSQRSIEVFLRDFYPLIRDYLPL